MIDKDDLKFIGFDYQQTPWREAKQWIHLDFGRYDSSNYLISYDVETKYATSVLGEFSIISRKCENVEDLKKFIDAIYFIKN